MDNEFLYHVYMDDALRNKLTERTILELIENKHLSKDDWGFISALGILSERKLEEYQDKLDWYEVSRNHNLTEQFIEKHKDKLSWKLISKYQNLSKEFVYKYIDKLDFEFLSYNYYLKDENEMQILFKLKGY